MKRIEEVCRLSGVSRRTLQYYDNEGILSVKRSEENYRLYDETAMARLWEILWYKEMGFELKEINVIIKLPEIEITDITIDNDSFKIMDESNNIFNSISIGDLNDAQKELKKKMKESAVEKGVLDIAKNNAETLLSEMLKSPTGDYDVKVEWK